jgi:tetrahydromethanopterin S-methyltransferase subunit A
MNFSDLAGEVCKIVFPIREEVFIGNPESDVAICTLSSVDLLKRISKSELMNKVALAGRLLSENKGIDTFIRSVIKNPKLDTIIVCGAEVTGHRTGHALFAVHKYGVDENNRIINSISPDPTLTVSKSEIQQFQKQITLVNKIGKTTLDELI